MRPKFVILEYGVAEGAENPFSYDPWALFPAWPRQPLSDQDYFYNDKVPMAIRSSRHMAEILGVINKYKLSDFEVVALQYQYADKYLTENRDSVFVVSASVGGFFNDEFMAKFKDHTYMAISAGNEGPEGEGLGATKPYWTAIGAVTPALEPANYSSWGKGLVSHVGIAGEEITYNYFGPQNRFIQGTSFACPQHATEIMNLMMAYHAKNGTKPPVKWVLEHRNKHTLDLEGPGKDLKTGFGIYRFHPLQYIPTECTLRIGEKTMTVGTKAVELTVEPQMINGTTMVTLRAISEALGAEVTYQSTTKTITIRR